MELQKLNRREIKTWHNINHDINKNEALKSLFQLGYTTKDRVLTLLKHTNSYYSLSGSDEMFHQFWMGRLKDNRIVKDLNELIDQINSK